MTTLQSATTRATFQNGRPGDRVTIRVPNGIGRNGLEFKEASGRVVMAFAGHLTLNMGGKFGRPGVATDANFVRIKRAA